MQQSIQEAEAQLDFPLRIFGEYSDVAASVIPLSVLFMDLRMLTFNIQGFCRLDKQLEVVEFARRLRYDLVFVQETNFLCHRDVDAFTSHFGLGTSFSFAVGRFTGVGVIVFNRRLLQGFSLLPNPDGRALCFDFQFSGRRFRCVNVYAPTQPSLSNAFFRDVAVHLLHPGTCIQLGDFNCVLDSYRDIMGSGHGRSTWNARELSRLISDFHLTDAWVHLHGNTFEATWSRGQSASRLDRIYVPQALCSHVVTCEAVSFPLTPIYISDHRAVLLELRLHCTSILRPWCFDGRILRDPVGRALLERLLKHSVASSATPSADWDRLKSAWQVLAAVVGRESRRRYNAKLQDAIVRIRMLQRGDTSHLVMSTSLAELKQNYFLLLYEASAALGTLHTRGGPSAHPEVIRYTHNSHFNSTSGSSPCFTGTPGMVGQAARFVSHFEEMAMSDDTVDHRSMQLHPLHRALPQLDPAEDALLRTALTPEEVLSALKAMKRGTDPGRNGLPVEFYIAF